MLKIWRAFKWRVRILAIRGQSHKPSWDRPSGLIKIKEIRRITLIKAVMWEAISVFDLNHYKMSYWAIKSGEFWGCMLGIVIFLHPMLLGKRKLQRFIYTYNFGGQFSLSFCLFWSRTSAALVCDLVSEIVREWIIWTWYVESWW